MKDSNDNKKKVNKKTAKILKESKLLTEDELEELNDYLQKGNNGNKEYKNAKRMKHEKDYI